MKKQVLKIPEKHRINIQTIDTYLFQRVVDTSTHVN